MPHSTKHTEPAKAAPEPESFKVGDVVNVRFRVTNVFDNGQNLSLVQHATEQTGGPGLTSIISIPATHVAKSDDSDLVVAKENPTGIANIVTPTPTQPIAPTPTPPAPAPVAPAKVSTKH